MLPMRITLLIDDNYAYFVKTDSATFKKTQEKFTISNLTPLLQSDNIYLFSMYRQKDVIFKVASFPFRIDADEVNKNLLNHDQHSRNISSMSLRTRAIFMT